MDPQSFDLEHVKHIIEAALLTASEPLQVEDLQKLFDGELDKEATSINSSFIQGCIKADRETVKFGEQSLPGYP